MGGVGGGLTRGEAESVRASVSAEPAPGAGVEPASAAAQVAPSGEVAVGGLAVGREQHEQGLAHRAGQASTRPRSRWSCKLNPMDRRSTSVRATRIAGVCSGGHRHALYLATRGLASARVSSAVAGPKATSVVPPTPDSPVRDFPGGSRLTAARAAGSQDRNGHPRIVSSRSRSYAPCLRTKCPVLYMITEGHDPRAKAASVVPPTPDSQVRDFLGGFSAPPCLR